MRRILAFLLTFTMLFSFTVYAEDTEETWSVYWYLCGSDLETNNGCATTDLQEMLEVQLPENVNVVIQTGGALEWQNELMDAEKSQRWLYNSEGLQLLEENDDVNMGEAQTLYEFLDYANTNFPADKVAVTFWNHGGGSVSGAAFDERYGNDSLDLAEMYAAFEAVWGADTEDPALELVGFDTCLMATIDVAATFQNFAKYLVASEETEPGNGWLYSGWMGALAEDPSMDGAELGVAICDTYYEGCEAAGTEGMTTLSLTDLSMLTPLLDAYEAFGQEAVVNVAEDPAFYAEFARAAMKSENYGGNNDEEGYYNMVDLGHLARQTAGILPAAADVLDALDDCVLYRVNGAYRAESTGLSCYYSYNGDLYDYEGYAELGTGEAFKQFYGYALTGGLDEAYMEEVGVSEVSALATLEDVDWNGMLLDLDENGNSVLTLGPEANEILASIGFSLYYFMEDGQQMLLGTDNDIVADWDNGVFTDNFRGVWGAIDGNLVYMELSCEGEDYNIYAVPVLLNGELYTLQVVYDFNTEAWNILGAVPAMGDADMAAKEMRLLEKGDVITTLWKLSDGTSDFELYEAADIKVTANTSFGEAQLMNGQYALVFEMQDALGNTAYSDTVTFDCADGEIFTTVNTDEDAVEEEVVDYGDATVLELVINQTDYTLNGEVYANDVAPIIRDSRTVLPIKLVASTLGAEVGWNQDEQAVTIANADTTIVIYINETTALVNEEEVELAVPAFIENSRTYLPVRFVSEYLGAEVQWDGATSTVTIIG